MTVAFIPVRGGSKSIPLKNIKEIAGRPLVYWTVKAANDCESIDVVYVATDSEQIAGVVDSFHLEKVQVISRSAETANDTASTESAMLEFAKRFEFDDIVLIQATSPLLTTQDLNGGIALYNEKDTDSVLSVVRQKRFVWKTDENGAASPINYDVFHRPRRQEFDGYLVENGAFYITSRGLLLKSCNRISGNIKAYEMDESTYFEIDEPSDWLIIEQQLTNRKKQETFDFSKIKMFITDCDGCLTDGGMYYSENGDELKKFNTKDGMAFKLLKERGIITGIITGEDREINARRTKKLGIDELHQGVNNKLEVLKSLCVKYEICLENVLYVGDDINDIECLKNVGYSACPHDAVDRIKNEVSYISYATGGNGVIREIVERFLQYKVSR